MDDPLHRVQAAWEGAQAAAATGDLTTLQPVRDLSPAEFDNFLSLLNISSDVDGAELERNVAASKYLFDVTGKASNVSPSDLTAEQLAEYLRILQHGEGDPA